MVGLYGYQWWNNALPPEREKPSADGENLWALGIFGQLIAINRREGIVMVQWSTWPVAEPDFNAQPREAAALFDAIATALR